MGDEEIGPCTRCGRPADRYTPVGEPICSECVEATPAEAPGDAPARQEVAVPDDYFDEGDGPHPAFLSWCDEIRAKAEAYRAGKAKLQSTRQGDKDDDEDLF